MTPRTRLTLALALALALAALAVSRAVALAGRARGARAEIARVQPTRLADATRARLAALEADVLITWFASAPERMPPAWRGLREEVGDLLEALERASGGRLRWETCDPDASSELAAYAALAQVKPRRVRTIARDAWQEASVWSTLSIRYGARPRLSIEGVEPASLGVLQGWIVAALDQLERPARPVVALTAPEQGFERLAERLALRADLVRLAPAQAATRRTQADVYLWAGCEPEDPAVVLDLLERGRGLVVATSAWRPAAGLELARPAFAPSGHLAPTLLEPLGLATLPGLVLDALCETRREAGVDRVLPWRVRCIAPNQDFRALEGQPNGTLVLEAPTALLPVEGRLEELGYDFTPLSTAGPDAWLQTPEAGGQALETLAPEGGAALPKPTLAALLAARDPRRGSLVLLGSESALSDASLARDDLAHGALVDVLLANLTSPQRLIAARMRTPRPQALPPLPAAQRALWRGLCVALPPALLALIALARLERRARGSGAALARSLRMLAAALLALLSVGAGAALLRALAAGRVDLTRDGLHQLSDETRALAGALEQPLRAQLVVSRALPTALSDLPRRVDDLLRELARSLPRGSRRSVLHPEELSAEELLALAARGAAPLEVSVRGADETSVRKVHATLLLESGGRELALDFPDARAAEPLELRVALALGRLAGDPRARGRVVMACDTPRLSPAEAHLEYQLRGLFAPTGADVYALARRALAQVDFEVVARDPRSREPLGEADLLVWLQPRRDVAPMLATLVEHLRQGGRALVAAQHFNVRARQESAQGFRTVLWPEPQFPDLDQHWLPALGVELVREVLCDGAVATLALPTEVQRPGEGRDFVLQESTQPFQLRALAARFAPDDVLVAGLGDQLFLWGNRFALDPARLARHGLRARPLMRTTEGAWSLEWKGGNLDPRLLAGPSPAAPAVGAQPLALRLEGRFPPLDDPDSPAEAAVPEGTLVLLGASEPFKDPHLADPAFRADQLLVNAAATLALGEPFGRIAARRAVVRGFEPPPSGERLALRAWCVGAFPALLALVALAWRVARGRGRVARTGARP